MAAMALFLVVLLGMGMLFVSSRYVFRYGLDGIKLDRYETGTEPIGDGEDPDASLDVPKGSFRVHINHLPTYDSDNQTYNLQIWNPSNNQYLMRVKLVSSADKVLYSSDLIRTGRKKDDLKLTGADKNRESATAVFTAYDKKTLEKIGSTEVQITLPAVPTTP